MIKMKNTQSLILLLVLLCGPFCYAQNPTSNTALRNKLAEIISPFNASAGLALKHIENGDTLTVNDHTRFPMQSVYKFPLAMAILHEVDEGRLKPDQKIHITRKELLPDTWSPLAKSHPEGDIDLTVTELLDYSVSKSDNNACDILFRLLGGTKPVDDYIHRLGYKNISIKTTEAEMALAIASAQETNWCYPSEMNRLLTDFYQGKHLSNNNYILLLKLMTASSNSSKRIKGKLPEATVVAHKTGTGNKVVNDAGIITLPDGNHLALSVFIKKSNEEYEEAEELIATLSKAVYDFYVADKPNADGIDMGMISYVTDSANKISPLSGNILISQNGRIFFEKSYGYADAVARKLLTKENSFQIASISKQFTAYGIMLLKSKGLIEYDSLVSKYLPGFPYLNITIRHLLNHTSGLPDFWDSIRPNLDTLRSNGNKDVLDYLIKHRPALQFEAGSQFAYCDIGYDFLANIIEQVSGLGYDVFMDRNIFKPLGMKQTYAYKTTDIRRIKNRQLAKGHLFKQQKFEYAHDEPANNFIFYLGDFYGDGSVVSTARDLFTWERALENCKLLPCEIQNEAIKPMTYKGNILYVDNNISYGFGWFLKTGEAGSWVYHTGFHPGNVHGFYNLVNKDITFIFLSNAETPNLRNLRNRIIQILEK